MIEAPPGITGPYEAADRLLEVKVPPPGRKTGWRRKRETRLRRRTGVWNSGSDPDRRGRVPPLLLKDYGTRRRAHEGVPIATEMLQLGLDLGPAALILWAICFVCLPTRPRQVLRDRSTATAWFRQLFAFGSKLARLLTKLVATLQQGPHQNPAGRLRADRRRVSLVWLSERPVLRRPHLGPPPPDRVDRRVD